MDKETITSTITILKKATEAEVAHKYIDIRGKKCHFSKFITGELYKLAKIDKNNPKLEYLKTIFETYQMDSLSLRIKSIKQLLKYCESPFDDEANAKKTTKTSQFIKVSNPSEMDVMYVKGVGPKVAAVLNKVEIFTADDLLHYYPRKHLDYSNRTKIKDLVVGQEATVFGVISGSSVFQSKNKSNLTIVSILISDESGTIGASWFHGKSNRFLQERYKSQYPKGANIVISGTVKVDNYKGILTIDKPETMIISGDFDDEESNTSLHLARIVPVYPLTENLNAKTLRRAIHNAIELFSDRLVEYVPDYIREKLELLDKPTAIKQIHFPDGPELLAQSRKRLVFEEFFLLQLRLAVMREQNKEAFKGFSLNIKPEGVVDKFVSSLPFILTNAQQNAFNEIVIDMSKEEPMQRLLQGDVGCGKTVVACMTLLAAVENGYQAAIMAPTEILAEQHFRNFSKWLTPFGLSVGFFVGKHSAKIRKEMNQNLKNGQTHIAVGTHALIQESVEFNNLGAIVIDEQHRFGVHQRKNLKLKGQNPEMLTMTATPIPRTLALTVHGDLDLTIIDELPQGRKPIKTSLFGQSERKKAHKLIRDEIEQGRQAYIVFPLIEESETLSAKAATKEAEKLQQGEFSDLNIGLVHGKMNPKDKDAVMEDFRNGKYHILVSTTVIEVGVDVPNATVIVIENAERFGLSQLHQLRGRVGRSDLQSYCILIADTKAQQTRERLEIMTKTNNGFIIAEHDMKLRGPGEFLGIRQSGLPDLHLADIVEDSEILELARETAFDFVRNHDIKDYPELKKYIDLKIQEGLELINAG